MSKNPDKPETFSEWTSLILYNLRDLVTLTNGFIAYRRGANGYWSVFRRAFHPSQGYQTGEKFVVRFRAYSLEELRQKWASY